MQLKAQGSSAHDIAASLDGPVAATIAPDEPHDPASQPDRDRPRLLRTLRADPAGPGGGGPGGRKMQGF
jgi:hypothetical protein